MKYVKKIFKGCHYGFPFPFPKCLKKFETTKSKITGKPIYYDEHIIKFDDTIIYGLPDEDQMDVNKLFGFSYGFHHTNSDRIGFRYVPGKGVEIVLYSYCNGKRESTKHIAYVEIGKRYNVSFSVELYNKERCIIPCVMDADNYNATPEIYSFYIYDNGESAKTKLRYSLGLYFGGNRRAPHIITIYDEQIKNKNKRK